MQICTLPQTDTGNHANTFSFTGWMTFLPPNQWCQTTDIVGWAGVIVDFIKFCYCIVLYI